MNQRIRELQEIVIGRKLLKILLKKIIECCFISFDICFDDKNILKLKKVVIKNEKYKNIVHVANKIIEAIFRENIILHIDKEFNKIIDIINSNTTYGNILEICDKSLLEEQEVDLIRQIINEFKLYDINAELDLLGKDMARKQLINEYIKKK